MFGAASSLVALMIWVYYSAQIFLLGAEFTRLCAHAHGSRSAPGAPASDDPVFAAPAPAQRRASALAKIGTALALGMATGIGIRFWRR